VVQPADTKPEKNTQQKSKSKTASKTAQKSKTASNTAQSKSSNKAFTGSDDVCIVDSDSQSEDFSCKKSTRNLNNSDVKKNKQSNVKPSDDKESSCSGTSVNCQRHNHEDNEQHLSLSKKKAADSTDKPSKGKKVKDEAFSLTGPSTRTSKSDTTHKKEVLLFLYQF